MGIICVYLPGFAYFEYNKINVTFVKTFIEAQSLQNICGM